MLREGEREKALREKGNARKVVVRFYIGEWWGFSWRSRNSLPT